MQMIGERLRHTRALWTQGVLLIAWFGLLGCGAANPVNAGRTRLLEQAPPIVGTWAKQMIFTSEATVLSVVSKSKVERLLISRLELVEGRLKAYEQPCDINSISSPNTKIVFPEALKRVLPQRQIDYQISENGELLEFRSEEAVEVLGARLGDSLMDPLPTQADDARVVDQDGDGHPGVTVEISSRAVLVTIRGKVFVTQRTKLVESGSFSRTGEITGQIQWSGEQYTLGSDSALLARVSPRVSPVMSESQFVMRKLDETASCKSLLANYDEIFTRPAL